MDQNEAKGSRVPEAIRYLIDDHVHIKSLFKQVPYIGPQAGKDELARHICALLEVHAQVEEELIYPVLAEIDPCEEGREHNEEKAIIEAIRAAPAAGPELRQAMENLEGAVRDHIAEEEDVAFPKLEAGAPDRMEELGHQVYQRTQQLRREHPDHSQAGFAVSFPAYPKV